MVTTRDIDAQIRELARVIGYGIDLALQPLDFSELCALMAEDVQYFRWYS